MARVSGSSSASWQPSSSTPAEASGNLVVPPAPADEAVRRRRSSDGKQRDWPGAGPHTSKPLPYDESLLNDGKRSLSLIGLQAFGCGIVLATCLIFSIQYANAGNAVWRFFALFGCLSLFHFLEYWTTAHYNGPATRASSFLLYSNGHQYNVAYACAALEIVVTHIFFPSWQAYLTNFFAVVIGLGLVIIGQATRSVAMATAGTNFNHLPAKVHREGHELVTNGIYAYLRHPSYFGFFWWALGTQVLVGNKICFVAYAVVLWKFFSDRITHEERSLVDFFGKDYEEFRKRTGTGIPFI